MMSFATDAASVQRTDAAMKKIEAVLAHTGGIESYTVISGYSEILLGSFRAADPLHGFVEQIRKAHGEDSAARFRKQLGATD